MYTLNNFLLAPTSKIWINFRLCKCDFRAFLQTKTKKMGLMEFSSPIWWVNIYNEIQAVTKLWGGLAYILFRHVGSKIGMLGLH